jgi:hypothetical protein
MALTGGIMSSTQLTFSDFPQEILQRQHPKARATAREADWRRQLARAFAYQAARSPEEAEELLAEYERREAEGPDFLRMSAVSTRETDWVG